MFSYHEVNLYLDGIDLPREMQEVLDYEYDIKRKELEFLKSAVDTLKQKVDSEYYHPKAVHCMGICLTNLTQAGLYFLLEDEVIFVHTSTLQEYGSALEWTVGQYRFKEIKEVDFNIEENGSSDYESGVLFLKIVNDNGTIRNRTLRNVNPNHFDCFRSFHANSLQNRRL